MKLKIVASTLLCVLITSGCAAAPANTDNLPYLNSEELTGLAELGQDYASIRFDYSLDSPKGKELPLTSCAAVEGVKDSDVAVSQTHLLRLMQVNCITAQHYFGTESSSNVQSFLPTKLSVDFIKNLPASAVPDRGGQSIGSNKQTLVQAHEHLEVTFDDDLLVGFLIDNDLKVRYQLMARGDFNNDGVVDMLLRLDWSVASAFGKGFDLLMITQTGGDSKPFVVQRW